MSIDSLRDRTLTALVVAGGTGGHVYPALAVATVLDRIGWSVMWVGTEQGIENRVVPTSTFPMHCLSVSGVRGKHYLARISSIFRLAVAIFKSIQLIRKLKPDVVLGMGGYLAGPVGIAAWITRRPLIIHEQNAVVGSTNWILAPLASRVLCGLPGAFSKRPKVREVGNPLRDFLCNQAREGDLEFKRRFSPDSPMHVLVLGGSLGAMPLNRLVPPAISELVRNGEADCLAVWQQCGEINRKQADLEWQENTFSHLVIDNFIENMGDAYHWADIVIARAGALTVSELAASGKPAVLIPLPHAIDDHQTQNAKVLVEIGAAISIPEHQATPELLARYLSKFLHSPLELRSMALSALKAARLDATEEVVTELNEVVHANL